MRATNSFRYLLEIGRPPLTQPLCVTTHGMFKSEGSGTTKRLSSTLLAMIAGAMGDYQRSYNLHGDWINTLREREDCAPDYELVYAYCEYAIALVNLNRLDGTTQTRDAQKWIGEFIDTFRSLPDFEVHWLTTPRIYIGLLYCSQNSSSDAKRVL